MKKLHFCHQCGNFIPQTPMNGRLSVTFVQDGHEFRSSDCVNEYEEENPYRGELEETMALFAD